MEAGGHSSRRTSREKCGSLGIRLGADAGQSINAGAPSDSRRIALACARRALALSSLVGPSALSSVDQMGQNSLVSSCLVRQTPRPCGLFIALVLCGLVVLVSGWTSATSQAPPTCSPHSSELPFRRPARPGLTSTRGGVGLQRSALTTTVQYSGSAAGEHPQANELLRSGRTNCEFRQPAPPTGLHSLFVMLEPPPREHSDLRKRQRALCTRRSSLAAPCLR